MVLKDFTIKSIKTKEIDNCNQKILVTTKVKNTVTDISVSIKKDM